MALVLTTRTHSCLGFKTSVSVWQQCQEKLSFDGFSASNVICASSKCMLRVRPHDIRTVTPGPWLQGGTVRICRARTISDSCQQRSNLAKSISSGRVYSAQREVMKTDSPWCMLTKSRQGSRQPCFSAAASDTKPSYKKNRSILLKFQKYDFAPIIRHSAHEQTNFLSVSRSIQQIGTEQSARSYHP